MFHLFFSRTAKDLLVSRSTIKQDASGKPIKQYKAKELHQLKPLLILNVKSIIDVLYDSPCMYSKS